MKITVRHQLRVSPGAGAARALEHILLTPLSGPSQTVKDWAIDMPGIETAARFTDAFGNRALLVTQARPDEEIAIAVAGVVETIDRNGVIGRVPGEPVVGLYTRVTPLTAPDPALVESFGDAARHGSGRIALYHAIMGRLGETFRFDGGGAAVVELQATGTQRQSQSVDGQTQSQGDQLDEREEADAAAFAHAFIATVRALGLPARFVTGYLAAGEDHPAAFHAWAEAWDDGLGWIAFDAALGICPTTRHIRVATGLDAFSTQAVRTVPQLAPPELVTIEAVGTGQ